VRRRSIGTLIALRLVIIANVAIVFAVGALCIAYYERPQGYVIGAAAWCFGAALVSLIRFTDPYRAPRRKRRGSTSR
jgi:hypothetical protein